MIANWLTKPFVLRDSKQLAQMLNLSDLKDNIDADKRAKMNPEPYSMSIRSLIVGFTLSTSTYSILILDYLSIPIINLNVIEREKESVR